MDKSKLLDDISHINQTNKNEIKRVREHIRKVIDEGQPTDDITDTILDEVSVVLGRLAVKVELTETAVRSIRAEQTQGPKPSPLRSRLDSNKTEIRLGVEALTPNPNLLPIQPSGNGSPYAWSGSDPQTRFTLALDRNTALGMHIGLRALIKPEFSKQLKILIDGIHTKHRVRSESGSVILSCNLPHSSNTGETEIKIVLPDTHSPRELGTSNDYRKLGIAICEIRFGKPENGFVHLLKRITPNK